jgi:putative ABC transport system permease protein
MGPIELGNLQLLLCLVFVALAGVASLALKLRLHKDILWATFRTVAQLFLMGYVLRYVFELRHPAAVLTIYAGMIAFAAWTARQRVKERAIAFLGPTLLSMVLSYVVVTSFVMTLIVRAEPWYLPRYFIPLGGMIVGNGMNAISIALDRLFSGLRTNRHVVEMILALGGTREEASRDIVRDAVRAGMIPILNSMMTVGIVFLPGMMTGQILAGADPVSAIRYQIMIMLMLLGSTTLGSAAVVLLVRRLCFTKAHQLRLPSVVISKRG